MLKWILLTSVVLALLLVLAGQAGLLRGQRPAKLGVVEGRLRPPSLTPNSVSSQTDLWSGHAQADYARIAPLPLIGSSAVSGDSTMARLQAVVSAMPGAQVVTVSPGYLYATFTTPVLRFTDDVEFWFDPVAQVVQVRSASRIGRKDFGVNRQRVEQIRQKVAAG